MLRPLITPVVSHRHGLGLCAVVCAWMTAFFCVAPRLDGQVTPAPGWCSMAHCNAQMSDFVPLTPPGIGQSVYVRNTDTTQNGVSVGDGCISNGTYVACAFRQSWNALVIYDGDGNFVWGSGALLDNHNYAGMPIMQADGSVVAGDDQHIYEFNSDGSVAWVTPSPGGVPVGLVPTPNGAIFTGTAPQQITQCWQANCTLGFTVLSGGSGYSSANVVLAGGDCPGATATATISGGAITAVTATSQGSDCDVAPDVIIEGNGSGASVSAAFTDAAPAAVYNGTTGTLVGSTYLYPTGSTSGPYYETINTACVNNGSYPNRVYVLTNLSTNTADGAIWALDIDPTNLSSPITPAWYLVIHGPSGASPLCVGNDIYFDGAGIVPTDNVGTTIFGVQDNGSTGSFLFQIALGPSSQPVTSNFAIDPRPEGGFWHEIRFDPVLYHRAFLTGQVIETVNVSNLLTERGAPPSTYWQAGIFTEYGSSTKPYLMLPEAAYPQTLGYLAMLDVAAQQLVWAVPLAGNDLDPSDTPGGDAALVMDSSGNPVVVMNAKQSGVYFITNGGPTGVVSGQSLDFGGVLIGATSAKQNVTLTNNSGSVLNISSIKASGPFKPSNNCGSSLAPGVNCSVAATFTPTAAMLQTGSITISTNSPYGSLTVALSGTGIATAPTASLSSTALTFASQARGTISAPQAVTLSNTGTVTLAIASITVSGGAAETSNCPTTLIAGASCGINAMLAAPPAGACTGTITINSNASGGPLNISLTGTCTATPGTESALSTSSLVFSPQPVGTVSAPQKVTLSNIGEGSLTVKSIAASGAAAEVNNCGSKLAEGAGCTISITFTPTAAGAGSGTVTVKDNAPDSPHVISISGVGTANPVPVINLPLVPAAVLPGTAGITLTVTGTGFVPGAVIDWNGSPRTTTYVSSSQLSAALTTADLAVPSTGWVSVVNPGPGGGQSQPAWLPVGYPSPVPFLNSSMVPSSSGPASMAAADFNADGKLDLAVTNSAANTVSILLGNGNGTFAGKVDYPTGTQPDGVAVGDFNHDGIPDLVVTNQAGNTVSILLGTGGGSFASQVTYATGNQPVAVAVADVNADGNLDLGVANAADNTVSILLGNGDGTFQAHVDYPAGQNPAALAAADFNRDGKLDLAVANDIKPGGTVTILLNHGDGSYLPGVAYATGDSVALTTADLNGDGILDLAAVNYLSQSLSVYLGNGNGTFNAASSVGTRLSPNPVAVAAADINSDGTLELMIASNSDDSIVALTTNDAVSFSQILQYGSIPGAGAMALGDFNNDGSIDMAVTLPSLNSIGILLQAPMAALSSAALNFGPVAVENTGTLALTVTNSGSAILNIGTISASGNFSQTNNCNAVVTQGSSCTINVTFSPAAAGTLNGVLTIPSNAAGSPQTVSLSGVGTGSPLSVGLSQTTDFGGLPVPSNTITLGSPAPPGGATVTLSSSNPAVAAVPASVSVAAGATVSSSFLISTSLVTVPTPVTIAGTVNGSMGSAVLTVNPFGASFTLAGSSAFGGVTLTGNVLNIASPAPSGGLTFNLSSSNPTVAAVPSTVTVPAGARVSSAFNIATTAVSSSTSVTITAGLTGITGSLASTNLNVLAAVPGSVALSPATVTGGLSTTANVVNLLGVAPAGGLNVSLSSSNPSVAAVPASVTVAAGASVSPPFTITTSSVTAVTPVTITATAAGSNAMATLTVDPDTPASVNLTYSTIGGGSSLSGTVTLAAPAPAGGATVQLTSSNPAVVSVPAHVSVSASSTVSAQFKITTTAVSVSTPVTITASYNGGTAFATLTVNPLAPISVNLSQGGVLSGNTIQATVTLNGVAPAGGAVVTLSSSDPSAAPVPPTVTVAAGSTVSPRFNITAGTVTKLVAVTISATYNGSTAKATLDVSP